MRIFRRPGAAAPATPCRQDPREELRGAVSSVVLLADDAPPPAARTDRRAELRRIVAEAVILQDQAVELLADIRDREPLSDVARRGGPLSRRFFELRRLLPAAPDAETRRQCETAATLLDHHGTVITYALDLLAMEWRSPAIGEQIERLDGLGEPAERLDALYTELAGRA
jgi:hypothetical protein